LEQGTLRTERKDENFLPCSVVGVLALEVSLPSLFEVGKEVVALGQMGFIDPMEIQGVWGIEMHGTTEAWLQGNQVLSWFSVRMGDILTAVLIPFRSRGGILSTVGCLHTIQIT
jgi:hypothetical protein